jgi:hypothetical protein
MTQAEPTLQALAPGVYHEGYSEGCQESEHYLRYPPAPGYAWGYSASCLVVGVTVRSVVMNDNDHHYRLSPFSVLLRFLEACCNSKGGPLIGIERTEKTKSLSMCAIRPL